MTKRDFVFILEKDEKKHFPHRLNIFFLLFQVCTSIASRVKKENNMRCQKFEFVSLSTDMFISTILRVSYMRKHNLFNLTVLNSIVQRFSRLYLKRVAEGQYFSFQFCIS